MNRKLLIALSLAVALVIFGVVRRISSGKSDGYGRRGDASVAVEVDSVRYGPITETRSLSGTISPQSRYVISPKVAGRLVEIRKRISDSVKPGEVVARIEDDEFLQAVKEAEANLAIAEANLYEARSALELARQELARAQSLQEKGIASPAELEQAQTLFNAREAGLQLAEAGLRSRQSSLDVARIRLSYTALTSASRGFVGERFVDEGAMLAVNTPIMSVVEFQRVIVKSAVVERDYARIQPGMDALISVDAYPGRSFTGEVSRIAPQIAENSRDAAVEIAVANDSLLLKPGMFARMELVLAKKPRVCLIPSAAVVAQDGAQGVFQVDPDARTAHFIPIKVGISNSDLTEVISPDLSGLVVTLGHHLLRDGSTVVLPSGDLSQAPGASKPRNP